jgi:hypothetical protein
MMSAQGRLHPYQPPNANTGMGYRSLTCRFALCHEKTLQKCNYFLINSQICNREKSNGTQDWKRHMESEQQARSTANTHRRSDYRQEQPHCPRVSRFFVAYAQAVNRLAAAGDVLGLQCFAGNQTTVGRCCGDVCRYYGRGGYFRIRGALTMARNYGKIGAPQEVDRTRCKLDNQAS